jgi:hypothetical protein
MIECIRVIGGDIFPFFIHKGKHVFRDFVELIHHSRVIIACSENGWFNNEIGFEWLKHFNKHIILTGTYRLLVLDSYGSHATFAFTNYARENKIVLFYFSPHTTHKFQLLDVAIF